MKTPPIFHNYLEPLVPEEYVKYMYDTFGHLLKFKEDMPAEIKAFLGKVPKFEDLPDWITEQEEAELRKDALIKEGKKASLVKKMDLGIVSEKGFSNLVKQLILRESCDIKGNYSHKTHMILDFITHKICTEWKEFTAHLVIDKDDDEPYTIEDIQYCREEWGNFKVFATDGEIRKTLGLLRTSNKEIAQTVEDCADLEFEGELFCYYDAEMGKYKSCDLGGSQKHFFGFIRNKSGNVARRTGYEEGLYCFTFDTVLSNILLINIMNGNIQIKDKDFYQLRGGLQNLGNYVLMWKTPTIINLKTLCALLGIKSKNVTNQQKLCEANLNEFKELGYISWVKIGKGRKARYKIWKKKRFLQPKEVKLLPESRINCPEKSNPEKSNFLSHKV